MEKINWREFNKETFKEAEQKDIPVLLSLSAAWCHWCHVMDQTSYSDDAIAQYINNNFVPIRVDADKRPDINDRFNMGGWPTTAFLTPEGHLMTGGTYIPPEEMKTLLEDIHTLYKEQKPDIIKQIKAIKAKKDVTASTGDKTLNEEIYQTAIRQIKSSYDKQFGGFGKQPKFPMLEAMELAAHRWLNRDDEECGDIFIKSLDAMRGGGMYDPAEGGFFRYSTTRDWSIPHFEKMLEDNSGFLRLLCIAYHGTKNNSYKETIKETLAWLRSVMFLPETKCWAGSQDADEHYYSLSLEQRKEQPSPYVDTSIYVNWNAQLAETLFLVATTLKEDIWHQKAVETLQSLEELCYGGEKGYAHYYDGQTAQVYGLLTDQVSVGCALAAAYQYTGKQEYLERSESLALWCLKKLSSPEGGLLDSLPDPHAPGDMAANVIDLQQNARAASWLILLGNLTDSPNFLEKAGNILKALSGSFHKYGIIASSYAQAVYSFLTPWIRIEISGQPGEERFSKLLDAALTEFIPNKGVVPRISRGTEAAKAFVCRGTQCYQPVNDSQELHQLLKRLISEN